MLTIDPLTYVIAQALSVQRETAELVRLIDAPRIEVQRRVALLCRHNFLDTPRANEQAALAQRVTLWPGYELGHGDESRLREETYLSVELATGTDGVMVALVQPLREVLDAMAAHYRESELFATRAAFAVPDPDPEDQTRRFLATLTRVKDVLCAREPALAVGIAKFFCGDGPRPAFATLRAGALAALEADVMGVAALAHTVAEVLLGVHLPELDPPQETDLVAAFFCDLPTLVRGDPPRPLPLWF